jgi:hypothetical protein
VKRTRLVALAVFLGALVASMAEAQTDWKKPWEASVEAAKKEREVTIYGPHNPAYQQVWTIFQKTYPDIKFSFVPGKGSDHAQRIVAERRAGKYLADLLMGGSSSFAAFAPGTLEPLKPLLVLPEVADPSGWFDGKYYFADSNNAALIISGEIGTRRGSYNTRLVDLKRFNPGGICFSPSGKAGSRASTRGSPAEAARRSCFFITRLRSGGNSLRAFSPRPMFFSPAICSRAPTGWPAARCIFTSAAVNRS